MKRAVSFLLVLAVLLSTINFASLSLNISATEEIKLVKAESLTQNTYQMLIGFNKPVKFKSDNLVNSIFVCNKADSIQGDDGFWQIGLADNDNIKPLAPQKINGNMYSNAFVLTFTKPIEKNGVIKISESTADNDNDLSEILCDTNGEGVFANISSSNTPDTAYCEYTLKDEIVSAELTAPNVALIKFAYDTNFVVENPFKYISAYDLSDYESSKIFASSYKKVDNKTYEFTFNNNLYSSGLIVFEEENIIDNNNDIGQIAIKSDTSEGVASNKPSNEGPDSATIGYYNPWVCITKTEYINENKIRLYFSEKITIETPKPELLFTACEKTDYPENEGWQMPAKSVEVVDGLSENSSVYDINFEGKINKDCYIRIMGNVFSENNQLIGYYIKSATDKYFYTNKYMYIGIDAKDDIENKRTKVGIDFFKCEALPVLMSARITGKNTAEIRFSRPVNFNVANSQKYIFYETISKSASALDCTKLDSNTYKVTFKANLKAKTQNTIIKIIKTQPGIGAIISGDNGGNIVSTGTDINGNEIVDLTLKKYTTLEKAEIIDASKRIVRLKFSEPVHINNFDNILMGNSTVADLWKANIEKSYSPVYENKSVINGKDFSKSIVVKFGDIIYSGDQTKISKKILPNNGNIIINDGNNGLDGKISKYIIFDDEEEQICANTSVENTKEVAENKYQNNVYAKIISALYENNKVLVTFDSKVKFNTSNPQNYIFVVSYPDNKKEIKAEAVTAIDGTNEEGATCYYITFPSSETLDRFGSIKLVENTASLINDNDSFAIGGLVKSIEGKPVLSTRTDTLTNYNEAVINYVFKDTEAPSVPKNIILLATEENNSATLSWDISTDNVGVVGYAVYRDGMQIGISTTTQYTDASVPMQQPVSYTIKAFDAAGNNSERSSNLTVDLSNSQNEKEPNLTEISVLSNTSNQSIQAVSRTQKISIPMLYSSGSYYPDSSIVTNSNIEVIFTPTDSDGGGVKEWRYQISNDNGVTWGSWSDYLTSSYEVISFTNENVYKIKAEVIDNADSIEYVTSESYQIDKTAPIITIGDYTTETTNQNITVTASTNEGTLNATSYTFTENGSFDFVATDEAGNKSTVTVTITNIDKSTHIINLISLIPSEITSLVEKQTVVNARTEYNSLTSAQKAAVVNYNTLISAEEKIVLIENSIDSLIFDSTTGKITGYIGMPVTIYIPTQINGVAVTSIGDFSFINCISLESIVIPSSIISLGSYVFSGCYALSDVTIQNGLWSIGYAAFNSCINLTSIILPNTVTSIGGYAFSGCSALENINIPTAVTNIADATFNGCSSLNSIVLPNNLSNICYAAFNSCSNLTSILIPSNVTSIGDFAFSGCYELSSVTIQNGLLSIGYAAFNTCTNLTSISIPYSVTNIGTFAFLNHNPNLTLSVVNASYAHIYAHNNDIIHSVVEAPEITIEPYSTSLTNHSVTVTVSTNKGTLNVTSHTFTENGSFNYLAKDDIGNITVLTVSINNIIPYYFDESTGTITGYYGHETEIVIPTQINGVNVTKIGNLAFYGNTTLTHITIPNNIIAIGSNVFANCSSLNSVTLPQNTILDLQTQFNGCNSLSVTASGTLIIESDLIIPEGITLNILPQSIIRVRPGKQIKVFGTLYANGNFGYYNDIVFTSTADKNYAPLGEVTDYNVSSGNYWYGIFVGATGKTNCSWVSINYANSQSGFSIYSQGELDIVYSALLNNIGEGIYVESRSDNYNSIYNNSIFCNGNVGIEFHQNYGANGSIYISGNEFSGNITNAIYIDGYGSGDIGVYSNTITNISNCSYGILINYEGNGNVSLLYNDISGCSSNGINIQKFYGQRLSMYCNYIKGINDYPIYINLNHFEANLDQISGNYFENNLVNSLVMVGRLQHDMQYYGDLVMEAGNINLNTYTLTINGTLWHNGGNITIGNGYLSVSDWYVLDNSGLLYINSRSECFNVNIGKNYWFKSHWEYDISIWSNLTQNNVDLLINGYAVGNNLIYNRPSSGSMVTGSVDREFLRVLWYEEPYCYVEYLELENYRYVHKRGYVHCSALNVDVNGNNYPRWSVKARSARTTVYDIPSIIANENFGAISNEETVTILNQENNYYYIEYNVSTSISPDGKKRGYIIIGELFDSSVNGWNYNDTYIIRNVRSGKCLDVYNGDTYDGTRVIQYDAHGGLNQQWKIKYAGDGNVMFQSALNEKIYLSVMHGNDLNGENIIIEGFASDGPDYWKTRYEFRIENYDDSGKFIISTNCSNNLKVLDVASDIPVHNGLDNRNPIIQYNKNNLPSDNQLWLFEKVPVTSSDGSSGIINSDKPTPPPTQTSIPVSSIGLDKTSVTCKTGEIITLTATLNPSNATYKTVTYTSSNPSVLTFNGGAATVTVTQSDTYWQPRGAGTATVTATTSNGKIAICTFTVNAFDYNSGTYSSKLATDSAEYAMLAYDEMELSGGYYIDSKNRKNQPDALISKLKADGFTVTNDDAYNYPEDNNPDNVAYVLAKKQVYRYGQVRTLVAVIIRGTNRSEWQGNMDVTGPNFPNDHYSFKVAETDLKTNATHGLDTYVSGITNPIYLITGHSRGAAVANLLASTLSDSAGASNVFAYTFATPNATQVPNTYRANIFNFVFNDDFVPQVPLDTAHKWAYGKYGITSTKTAGTLYNSSSGSAFKTDMNRFLNGRDAQFNYSGTQNLLDHISDHWANTNEYNNNSCFNGPTIPGTAIPVNPSQALNPLSWQTLHDFMHDEVAKAAMGDLVASAMVVGKIPNYYFGPIASFFVTGSPDIQHYIFDAHHPFTYYTAVKYGLFN